MKRKRFLVFAYSIYYPSGGLEDVVNSFESKEEAEKACDTFYDDYDFIEIYDRIQDEFFIIKE